MEIFQTIFSGSFTLQQFLIAVVASMLLGLLVALVYCFRNSHSKSLALGLVLIPAVESVVIMMVNGNLGVGIAVAGSFSLIRFRSVKGTAKELSMIFIAMAIGIMCGSGYIALAVVFTIIVLAVCLLLTTINFGNNSSNCKYLKVTIPESLNYDEAFNTILDKYTKKYELTSIKTLNLGSLFRIEYDIELKDSKDLKKMIDELRTRNGNLEIMCSNEATSREEL